MIKYSLKCSDCEMTFEGWFRNSEEYDKQSDKKLISCPKCDFANVNKDIMTPQVQTSEFKSAVQDELTKIKDYIKNNFEDVGEKFTDEAIAMYRGDADPKNIHGTITKEDAERLEDEGVPAVIIPWKKNKS